MRILKLLTISFVLFLSACSSNGVDKNIHKDGEIIINTVYESFNDKKYISEEDGDFIYDYFQKNYFPEDGNFKNASEEFLYSVAWLEIIHANYIDAIKKFDLDRMKEQEEKFNKVLQETIDKFNIELEEQS